MAHLRIQKPGNLDQTILDDIQAISEISLFENLSARLEPPFGRNFPQSLKIRRRQLGKKFAGLKLHHAVNLNERGSQEQARMLAGSQIGFQIQSTRAARNRMKRGPAPLSGEVSRSVIISVPLPSALVCVGTAQASHQFVKSVES
jgi:hypothetical protein